MARPTIDRSDWRLVITPATCGSGARANAAPPLKSTSTKASRSGGWVAARPATIVRSSSLLPTRWRRRPGRGGRCRARPPPWSSTTRSPPAVTPTGTWSGPGPGRAGRAAAPVPPARPFRVGARAGAAPGAGRTTRRRRPAASARMPPTRRPPGAVSCGVANPWSSRRTRAVSSDGSPAVVSASQSTVTPPAPEQSGSSSAARPGPTPIVSRIATRWGRAPGPARARGGRRPGPAGGGGRVAGVGQRGRPRPGRVGGEDPEVVGSVEGGELADDRPGERAGPVRRAGEGEHAGAAERDGHRGVRQPKRHGGRGPRRPPGARGRARPAGRRRCRGGSGRPAGPGRGRPAR